MKTYKLDIIKFKINIILKILISIIIIFIQLKFTKILNINSININKNYVDISINLKLSFNNSIINKIKIGIYSMYTKNGGRARITSLLLNYLDKCKIFKIYFLTNQNKLKDEYTIPYNIKRIFIKNENENIKYLIKEIIKIKLDIFIYQFSYIPHIDILNNLKKIKIIFYIHQSIFYWIYSNYTYFNLLYKSYQKSKYIISLVNFENNYIFKKWGIKSVLMNNFLTYEYNSIIASDLSSENILMVGRADDKFKRFELGIQSMEYIIQYISDCEMKIISNISYIDHLKFLVDSINLHNNVKFFGYTSTPEIYFKNASLNIFPSISESFGLVLCETKIYGIPNIIIGLDYISVAHNGTIIIYDDMPEYIAKESLIILKNKNYKINIGKIARNSMKLYNNEFLLYKWVNLILSVYFDNNKNYYLKFSNLYQKNNVKDVKNIIINQIKLMKKRNSILNYFNYYDKLIKNLIR